MIVAELIGGSNSTLNAKTLGMRPLSFFYRIINDSDSVNWDDIISGSLFLNYRVNVPGNNPYKIITGGNQAFVINFVVENRYGCQIAFTWGSNKFAYRTIIMKGENPQWGDWQLM